MMNRIALVGVHVPCGKLECFLPSSIKRIIRIFLMLFLILFVDSKFISSVIQCF
jgi:hypothetical protein